MFAHVLYGWLVVVGLIDMFLVAPALARALGAAGTVGRLLSTLAVLAGLVVASIGRLFVTPPLTTPVTAGLLLIDVGLLGYAVFLPERGVLHLMTRRRQQ